MKAFGSQIIAEFVHCSAPLLHRQKDIEALLTEGIQKFKLELKSINSYQFEPAGVTAIAIIGASHVAVHTYPEAGHLSLDIFTCSPGAPGPMQLMHFLKERLQPEYVRHKVLSRGRSVHVDHKDYITDLTHSGFNTQYQIEKERINKRTAYQHLMIIENKTFGAMMFLDNQLQIAESDAHLYNQALVAPLKNRRRVLILGGGDGGVLNHLLATGAQEVVMVDIDAEVVAAAQKHLPEVCGTAFADSRSEIVIEEARSYLKACDSQCFDSVIYDLTMEPEAVARENGEQFFEDLFDGIEYVLRPGGFISLQVGSHFDTRAQQRAHRLLNSRFKVPHFETVFIPSFCEGWVFGHALKT